ncbi:MAG: haloalkane dehalogenase [Kofleriaceae bacterium]
MSFTLRDHVAAPAHVASLALAATLLAVSACGTTAHPAADATTVDAPAPDGPVDAPPAACPAVSAVQPRPMHDQVLAPPGLPTVTMRYVEAGTGPTTFVLLHGIPTSSYEWRNVIPGLAELGRVVAPDLIGFGASDHPDRDLDFAEHVAYLGAFLDGLALDHVILVVHDLGSVAGLAWAAQHPDRVRGLVAMESLIPDTIPASVAQSPSGCTAAMPDAPACLWLFFRSPAGQSAIVDGNFFIDNALAGEPCPPSPAALDAYRATFPTPASRLHLANGPALVPVDGVPATFAPMLADYARWLETSTIPKLVLYSSPGFLSPAAVAQRAAATWHSTEARDVGRAFHFIPEVQPAAVTQAIRDWYARAF